MVLLLPQYIPKSSRSASDVESRGLSFRWSQTWSCKNIRILLWQEKKHCHLEPDANWLVSWLKKEYYWPQTVVHLDISWAKTATFLTECISGVRKGETRAFAAEKTRNQWRRSRDPRAGVCLGKTGALLLRVCMYVCTAADQVQGKGFGRGPTLGYSGTVAVVITTVVTVQWRTQGTERIDPGDIEKVCILSLVALTMMKKLNTFSMSVPTT